MKKFLTPIAFILMIQAATAQKATYTFGSGALNDFSGNGHNATMVGTASPTTDRFGNVGCAYRFPGTGTDYLVVAHHADFNIPVTGAFSISLWYHGGTPAQGDFETLFGKGPFNLQNLPTAYHLGLYDLNKPSGGATFSPVIMPTAAQPYAGDVGNWTHLVLIYNNTNWSLYINGTICGICNTPTPTPLNVNTDSVYMGRYYLGDLDDVNFYDVAITPTQITALYNNTNSCHGVAVNSVSKSHELSLYPDPATDVLIINNNVYQTATGRYSIINTTGTVVKTGHLISGKELVSIADLPAGMYFVKVAAAGEMNTLKFVKH